MKNTLFIIMALLCSCLPVVGETTAQYELFVDSLTGVQLRFPSNTQIKEASSVAFRKCVAVLEKSNIEVYSMKNREDEQYDWKKINEFDKDSKYGQLYHSERIGDKTEGWIRFYKSRTSKGKEYVTSVILIRGDIYAFYLLESAWTEEELSSIEVARNSVFPQKEESQLTKIVLWILIGVSVLAFILRFFREQVSDSFKTAIIILFTVSLVGYLILYGTDIWVIILWGCIAPCCLAAWLFVSWKELWEMLWDGIKSNL